MSRRLWNRTWERDLHWYIREAQCERRQRRRQARTESRCIANAQTEPETEEPCKADSQTEPQPFAFRTLAELVTDFKHRLREREKAKEELGSAQLVDSFVTLEPLFELDTQPLLAPPPPELSYRQKKSEEWFTRCHRAGPDLPTARSSASKSYDEHFPLPRVRL